MNLAEATAQLRIKESEIIACADELKKIETMISQGLVGKVSLVVDSIKSGIELSSISFSLGDDVVSTGLGENATFLIRNRTDVITIKVTPATAPALASEAEAEAPAVTEVESAAVSDENLADVAAAPSEPAVSESVLPEPQIPAEGEDATAVDISVGGGAEAPAAVVVASEQGEVEETTVREDAAEAPVSAEQEVAAVAAEVFVVAFDCSLLPEATYLRSELLARHASTGEEQTIYIKGTFESFAGAANAKSSELAALRRSKEELLSSVRKPAATAAAEGKSSSSAKKGKDQQVGKKKTSKKSAAAAASTVAASSPAADSEAEPSSTAAVVYQALESVSQGAMMGAALAVEHRAFWLFGLAAWGIYVYGEYASI